MFRWITLCHKVISLIFNKQQILASVYYSESYLLRYRETKTIMNKTEKGERETECCEDSNERKLGTMSISVVVQPSVSKLWSYNIPQTPTRELTKVSPGAK